MIVSEINGRITGDAAPVGKPLRLRHAETPRKACAMYG
jgi:hypothetical protein